MDTLICSNILSLAFFYFRAKRITQFLIGRTTADKVQGTFTFVINVKKSNKKADYKFRKFSFASSHWDSSESSILHFLPQLFLTNLAWTRRYGNLYSIFLITGLCRFFFFFIILFFHFNKKSFLN